MIDATEMVAAKLSQQILQGLQIFVSLEGSFQYTFQAHLFLLRM